MTVLLENGDYLGIEEYNCEQIRKKKKRTPKETEQLAVHDADKERILREPEVVMEEARRAMDRAATLFLKLIRSERLAHTSELTEKGKAEGLRPDRWDGAMQILCSRINYLNRQLVRLAESNAPRACWHLWFESNALTEAFTRLALIHPEEFQELAEKSLFMPSFRARNANFTADAVAISKAIHLSEKHPTPNIWDNNSRAGALCHLVVINILENIRRARSQYAEQKRTLEMLKRVHEYADEYRDSTLEEFMERYLHPVVLARVRACAALPEWKEDASAWWKGMVLALVKEEFQSLAKNHQRNPALWSELGQGGERDTENDRRRYMEKLCKNKFDQIVKDCP